VLAKPVRWWRKIRVWSGISTRNIYTLHANHPDKLVTVAPWLDRWEWCRGRSTAVAAGSLVCCAGSNDGRLADLPVTVDAPAPTRRSRSARSRSRFANLALRIRSSLMLG